MQEDNRPVMVAIQCPVYNHESFLRQCLDGFVMQKTDFRFVVIVHDDCSTDCSADIIREYAMKYPDIISPIYEEENLYSRHDDSLRKILDEAILNTDCKYVALCEGDDYWTDPLKLQKQITILEEHPNYTMICNGTYLFSEARQAFIGESRCLKKSGTLNTKDVICKGGLYISTCSIVYKRELREANNYPWYCEKCHVGDYPLQILGAMKGEIYYLDQMMSVYRVENSNSWVGRQKEKYISRERLNGLVSEVNMLNGFKVDYPKYQQFYNNRIAYYVIAQINPLQKISSCRILYTFRKEILDFNYFWKIHLKMKYCKFRPVLSLYYRIWGMFFLKEYINK